MKFQIQMSNSTFEEVGAPSIAQKEFFLLEKNCLKTVHRLHEAVTIPSSFEDHHICFVVTAHTYRVSRSVQHPVKFTSLREHLQLKYLNKTTAGYATEFRETLDRKTADTLSGKDAMQPNLHH